MTHKKEIVVVNNNPIILYKNKKKSYLIKLSGITTRHYAQLGLTGSVVELSYTIFEAYKARQRSKEEAARERLSMYLNTPDDLPTVFAKNIDEFFKIAKREPAKHMPRGEKAFPEEFARFVAREPQYAQFSSNPQKYKPTSLKPVAGSVQDKPESIPVPQNAPVSKLPKRHLDDSPVTNRAERNRAERNRILFDRPEKHFPNRELRERDLPRAANRESNLEILKRVLPKVNWKDEAFIEQFEALLARWDFDDPFTQEDRPKTPRNASVFDSFHIHPGLDFINTIVLTIGLLMILLVSILFLTKDQIKNILFKISVEEIKDLSGIYDMFYTSTIELAGRKGSRIFGLFLTIFSYLVCLNLVGLLFVAVTAKSQLSTTFWFSLTIIFSFILLGIRNKGLNFFLMFWNTGVGIGMRILLLFVEVLSFAIRPFYFIKFQTN